MRNRAQTAAPVPLRGPLLAALDVEYARASRAKNLERMAEIAGIVEALKKLWPEPAPAPVLQAVPAASEPAPAPPPAPVDLVHPGHAVDALSVPDPTPPGVLLPVEATVALPPPPQEAGGFSLRDLLQRADPAPPVVTGNGQGQRRRDARELVTSAVADENRRTDAEQFRYELALLVSNENMEAMTDMQAAATAAGLPVKAYAQRVIATHNARRRRAARLYAIEEQALRDIDAASGETIDIIAAKAVQEIRGEDA